MARNPHPDLGFDRRQEAFRRLFKLYDEHRQVKMQPNRAMLIPVKAMNNESDWWIWELVEEGNATYLFRPRTEEMEEHLFTWLGQVELRRRDMLDSKDLQRKTGYVGRVIHRDGEETLDSWWATVCEKLGREGKK